MSRRRRSPPPRAESVAVSAVVVPARASNAIKAGGLLAGSPVACCSTCVACYCLNESSRCRRDPRNYIFLSSCLIDRISVKKTAWHKQNRTRGRFVQVSFGGREAVVQGDEIADVRFIVRPWLTLPYWPSKRLFNVHLIRQHTTSIQLLLDFRENRFRGWFPVGIRQA